MESNEQYLTLEELKNIMSDYPLQYIVCGELATDLFLNECTHKEIIGITISREEMDELNAYFRKRNYQFVVKTH